MPRFQQKIVKQTCKETGKDDSYTGEKATETAFERFQMSG